MSWLSTLTVSRGNTTEFRSNLIESPMPIYLIRNAETNEPRLVRAPNAPNAVRYVARTMLTAEVASQEQLVMLLTLDEPIPVEDCSEPRETEELAALAAIEKEQAA